MKFRKLWIVHDSVGSNGTGQNGPYRASLPFSQRPAADGMFPCGPVSSSMTPVVGTEPGLSSGQSVLSIGLPRFLDPYGARQFTQESIGSAPPECPMFPRPEAVEQIYRRNQLRRGAQLPLLSVEQELQRIGAAHDQTEFEALFAKERSRYAHLWSNPLRGWLANMGIYGEVRRRLREMALESRN